ncbi:MAG: TraR/DksA C4-type zinc finger protein [Burkholderiaceae bacterium]|nr:TraR/DksA C4-type zinc finger protein [Burkholderiaceae bacterium]
MHERGAELSAPELQQFSERLRALRADVAAAVAAQLHQEGDARRAEAGLPRRAEETDDDAAAEAARQMDIAQLSHATAELAEIDAALARIAEGTYGICIDCGGPVGRARLQVQPMAVRCAPCQASHEKRRPR